MTNFGHLHHPHHNISRARWQHMIPSIFSGRHYLLGPVASLGGSFWDEKIHRPCLNLSRYSRYNSGSFRHLIPHHTPDRIGYSVIDHLVKSTFKYVEFMQLSCKLHQIALHLWASWNLGKKRAGSGVAASPSSLLVSSLSWPSWPPTTGDIWWG